MAYTVAESVPSGWDLSLGCVSSLATSTINTASPPTATITLGAGDTVTCTFTDLAVSAVTSSSLCPFDVDATTAGRQFRLILTRDPQNPSTFKLTASNPGQFYYNVFDPGAGGLVNLDIKIPYPFVTQGAVPIQIHDGFSTNEGGCFVPGPDVTSNFTITAGATTSPSGAPVVVLSDYSPQSLSSTATVMVSGPVPLSGLAYVTIHLDYGLKQTTGWTKGTNNEAMGSGAYSEVTINHPESYAFSSLGT
ncbi:MAG: hypothetical protein HY002_21905 [Candidatus Rokubacteria bacterium]|nr:hypothetical protein [Candidatus Rokubacteria bacterium]